MSLNHGYSLLSNIIVVKVLEASVHPVVHIAHENTEVTGLVAFEPRDFALNTLETEFSDQLTGHLVALVHSILTMFQMSCDYIEHTVLQSEIVGDTSFVANSSSDRSF